MKRFVQWYSLVVFVLMVTVTGYAQNEQHPDRRYARLKQQIVKRITDHLGDQVTPEFIERYVQREMEYETRWLKELQDRRISTSVSQSMAVNEQDSLAL
ncbi:hypothetical protein KAR48_18210, partial [bacterium]|nr:hypothetical protein [bacterium]